MTIKQATQANLDQSLQATQKLGTVLMLNEMLQDSMYMTASFSDIAKRVREILKLQQTNVGRLAFDLQWTLPVTYRILAGTYDFPKPEHELKVRQWCYNQDQGIVVSTSRIFEERNMSHASVSQNIATLTFGKLNSDSLDQWCNLSMHIQERDTVDRFIVALLSSTGQA